MGRVDSPATLDGSTSTTSSPRQAGSPASAAALRTRTGYSSTATLGGAGKSQSSALTRKLKKVLDVPMDDNMRMSLAAISDVYTTGASSGRVNLRAALERRTLALHKLFLNEYKILAEQFERVEQDVDKVTSSCTRMAGVLEATRQESQAMTDQVAVLQAELDEAKQKEKHVNTFLKRFHLTAEEKAVLQGDITPQFFTVLEKVTEIHAHCSDLLTAQHQQAGIQVMELTYMQQNQGYKRLNTWIQQHSQEILAQDLPEVPTMFVRAVNTLQGRAPLWSACMRDIAKSRRTAVVRKFFTAMTRGIEPAAAEGGADSPLRFVGDMLAWVHQSVAEESDFMDNFFVAPTEGAPSDLKRTASTVSDIPLDVSKADMLDHVFDGVVKHLRTKIDQVFENTPTMVTTNLVFYFRLESVLQFYTSVIPPLLGDNASLSVMLNDVKLGTLKHFFDILKAVSDKLLGTPLAVGNDLSPPLLIHEALSKLRLMIDTLADSLIPPEQRETEFAPVLSGIVDPILTLLEKHDGLDPAAHSMLSINCVQLMLTTFADQPFTAKKALHIQGKLEDEVQKLTRIQAAHLLRRSGLADIVDAIRSNANTPSGAPLSASSSASPAAAQEGIHTFYRYMYTLGSAALPLADKVQAMRLKSTINQRTLRAICDAYEEVYHALTDPANGYAHPTKLLQHTPENVRTLLDCE
eukprot:TRINITY_DN4378_c0_g1_i2.p1 TRINITY_DN4378_c0_g1~~TRINITY_DN4378_c0_g1_i2.p1  ORF type:complete len:716 (+),score=268.13 TRINITY_DN4378_c0_g1_i2:73-2148(+)